MTSALNNPEACNTVVSIINVLLLRVGNVTVAMNGPVLVRILLGCARVQKMQRHCRHARSTHLAFGTCWRAKGLSSRLHESTGLWWMPKVRQSWRG